MKLARLVSSFTVSLVGLVSPIHPQQITGQFRLYPSSEAGQGAGVPSVTAVVAPDGLVPLTLERPDSAPEAVDLALSTFSDERGNRLDLRIRLPGDHIGQGTEGRRRVSLGGAIIPLNLEVGRPPTSGSYTGFLFVIRGKVVLARYKIVLSRPALATLVLDRDTIVVASRGAFALHLREASGERPLDGVFVRLLGVDGGRADFDPSRDLTFEIQGTRIPDLWTLPARDTSEARLRRVAPGQDLAVTGTLRGLPAGEYRMRLRFLAVNSAEDPRQVLSLTVHVRAPAWRAGVVLLIAILLSYGVTKSLKTRQLRQQLWTRLDHQRPPWLPDEPPLLPIVWVRTIFRQAQDLSRRRLLSGMEVIDTRLKQASQLVPRLDRLRKIRLEIKRIPEKWVARRAEKARQQIVSRLGTSTLEERSLAEIDAALTDLEAWFAQGQREVRYWANLRKDMDGLIASVRSELSQVPGPARQHLDTLVQELESYTANEPKTLDAKIESEIVTYATLKVLWERFGKPELNEDFERLIDAFHGGGKRGQEMLDTADGLAWERLKEASKNDRMAFVSPRSDASEPSEAYQPLLFEVKPLNPAVGDNYLFKHQGLTYEWHIKLKPNTPWWVLSPFQARWVKRRALELHPVTSEPRVMQYVPRAGTVSAWVEVWRDPHQARFSVASDAKPHQLRIEESRDFRNVRAFETVEVWALVLTTIVALATGLATLYLGKPVFGTLQDYFGLLLWGVGADQTKNVLQIFQSYAPSPIPTSGG